MLTYSVTITSTSLAVATEVKAEHAPSIHAALPVASRTSVLCCAAPCVSLTCSQADSLRHAQQQQHACTRSRATYARSGPTELRQPPRFPADARATRDLAHKLVQNSENCCTSGGLWGSTEFALSCSVENTCATRDFTNAIQQLPTTTGVGSAPRWRPRVSYGRRTWLVVIETICLLFCDVIQLWVISHAHHQLVCSPPCLCPSVCVFWAFSTTLGGVDTDTTCERAELTRS